MNNGDFLHLEIQNIKRQNDWGGEKGFCATIRTITASNPCVIVGGAREEEGKKVIDMTKSD
ncbi:unnamed protein product [Onchocerca flexuosa]|uniref:AlbA_2 domain-containing protein n=1 Tax=Onchocerca flexuosa TaxID=387005 RepID=A0A183HAL3_9BILA|nr:unnamed protein product [Onchocerca flexuosa]